MKPFSLKDHIDDIHKLLPNMNRNKVIAKTCRLCDVMYSVDKQFNLESSPYDILNQRIYVNNFMAGSELPAEDMGFIDAVKVYLRKRLLEYKIELVDMNKDLELKDLIITKHEFVDIITESLKELDLKDDPYGLKFLLKFTMKSHYCISCDDIASVQDEIIDRITDIAIERKYSDDEKFDLIFIYQVCKSLIQTADEVDMSLCNILNSNKQ